MLMWSPHIYTETSCADAIVASDREPRSTGALSFEFSAMTALEAYGKQCEEHKANEEDSEH